MLHFYFKYLNFKCFTYISQLLVLNSELLKVMLHFYFKYLNFKCFTYISQLLVLNSFTYIFNI